MSKAHGAGNSPFWQQPLHELSLSQWEALCDHCGQCCLHALEDEKSGVIVRSAIACKLYDLDAGRCGDYDKRFRSVPACVNLRGPGFDFSHMPATCAYRLRAEGKPLPTWHPLLSGDDSSVAEAGIAIKGRALSARDIHEDELEQAIVAACRELS